MGALIPKVQPVLRALVIAEHRARTLYTEEVKAIIGHARTLMTILNWSSCVLLRAQGWKANHQIKEVLPSGQAHWTLIFGKLQHLTEQICYSFIRLPPQEGGLFRYSEHG